MQRIGQQKQRIGNRRILCGKNRALTAAIGVPRQAQANSGRDGAELVAEFLSRAADAFAIMLGAAYRRAGGTLLTVGEVAAKRQPSGVAEGLGYSDQQRRLAIRSSAVKERDRGPWSLVRLMQPASNQFAFQALCATVDIHDHDCGHSRREGAV
jgi:hypothetical protein